MSNATGSSSESNPSRAICDLRADVFFSSKNRKFGLKNEQLGSSEGNWEVSFRSFVGKHSPSKNNATAAIGTLCEATELSH